MFLNFRVGWYFPTLLRTIYLHPVLIRALERAKWLDVLKLNYPQYYKHIHISYFKIV